MGGGLAFLKFALYLPFGTFTLCKAKLCAPTLSNVHVKRRLHCVMLRFVAVPVFQSSFWQIPKKPFKGVRVSRFQGSLKGI